MKINWQLYTMRGSGAVARELDRALKSAVQDKPATKEGGQAAYNEWHRTAKKYARFGAVDTEPEVVACELIEQALGLPPYTVER